MSPRPQSGFTLIEVLVVMVIITVAMSVIVAGFTGADQEQGFRGYAERLALRIEMARDRAIQTNHEWGLYVRPDELVFAEFDHVNGEWLERNERPFKLEITEDAFRFRVKIEAYPGQDNLPNTSNDDNPVPAIILFSSGETTPFKLWVEPDAWQSAPWILSSDGFSRTSTERDAEA